MLASPFFPLLLSSLAVVQAIPEIKLGKTTLSGRDISPRVEFYGGIPFAEPPVGALRLRPPILKTRLDARTFNASEYGKGCLQPFADPSTLSEDCLTINIHRPKGLKSSAKLPVLFWTYGGGFGVGSSNTYNGSEIVEKSVARGTPLIFVNFNYRLGPLGFPQGQEADDQRSLNLGVLDLMAALEWVQAKIGFFGGDKEKVTIFGESAGSIMTGLLYMSPELEHWARGAVLTLYPEDPSVGSPYGTGVELFGLPASYKRHASIVGDLVFDAPRRMLSVAAAKAGVKSYVYQFTQPQPERLTGVAHSSEVQFVFGQVPPTGPGNLPTTMLTYGNADEAARNVSTIMMDYWISFAVSLNPNDGKGIKRQ
ncbi:hypothetical protein H1R20_g15226, partial [Candolleomyces eurysporus]